MDIIALALHISKLVNRAVVNITDAICTYLEIKYP